MIESTYGFRLARHSSNHYYILSPCTEKILLLDQLGQIPYQTLPECLKSVNYRRVIAVYRRKKNIREEYRTPSFLKTAQKAIKKVHPLLYSRRQQTEQIQVSLSRLIYFASYSPEVTQIMTEAYRNALTATHTTAECPDRAS